MSELKRIVEFLKEIDERLAKEERIYVIGGGAITLAYSPDNRTSDIDAIDADAELVILGGPASDLSKKHGVHISKVFDISFSAPPGWRERCHEMSLGLNKLSVFVADAYDIVFGKLARLDPKDIDDIQALRSEGHIHADDLLVKLNQNLKEVGRSTAYRNNAVLLFSIIFNQSIVFSKGLAMKVDKKT